MTTVNNAGNAEKPQLLPVRTLLGNDLYWIPLYQRNYAWEKTEIDQLLLDVWQRFEQDCRSTYHIGSLVVFETDPRQYEVIDGQQRHTTLTLINTVIRKSYPEIPGVPAISNLRFKARSESDDLIRSLLNDFDSVINSPSDDTRLQPLLAAIKDIQAFFQILSQAEPKDKVLKYIGYLYDHVAIVRIGLPESTDLNQYFEIMNNRGEQLEPHEILKAKFLGSLSNQTEKLRRDFAQIWDACSQMEQYVQSGFDKDSRALIFGTNWKLKPFDYLKTGEENENNKTVNGVSLLDLLQEATEYPVSRNQATEPEPKFRSIINFSNFLLQVLKLTSPNQNISLDDKNLLDEFGCNYKSDRRLPKAIDFINKLFFYRICFDNYLIKREEGGGSPGWKIQYLEVDNDHKAVFTDSKPLIMLQSMLQASFPGNTYKNWLQSILSLFEQSPDMEEKLFYEKLKAISKRIFDQTNKNLENGTATPVFMFNYLDFKLWEIYRSINNKSMIGSHVTQQVRQQIERNKSIFHNFHFTQSNSVEHVAPQKPDEDKEHHVKYLHSFGNLCLISRSTNSKYSNAVFSGKKDYFNAAVKNNQVESLKQTLIFSHDRWKDPEILEHEKAMVNILFDDHIWSSLSELVSHLKINYAQEMVPRKYTNLSTITLEDKPQPKYLYRGERTINWPTSMTTYSRSLSKDQYFSEINVMLTGIHRETGEKINNYSLYFFLRDSLYGIGALSKENYDPQIDVDLAGIFQHYGFDSSFLDVTGDINIAASFASKGTPGDIGQIMVLETANIEDQYFELINMPGNRAKRQNAYALHGTTLLDLKNDNFTQNYRPVWLRFKLITEDKVECANPAMLDTKEDKVAAEIKLWYNTHAKNNKMISAYTKAYFKRRLDSLY